MSRPVRPFKPLWFDHQFKKELRKLTEAKRNERLDELAALALTLAECRHPTHDLALQPWRPSAYQVPKIPPEVRLYEYRCAFPLRVIVRWVEPTEREPEGTVLLVAATLSHDHERLKDILKNNRSELRSWS
jgi:hypothetical protein